VGLYRGRHIAAANTHVHAFVELMNVHDPKNPSRVMTNVEGHAGNYPWNSLGCVLFGEEVKEAHKVENRHDGSINDTMSITNSVATSDNLRDLIETVMAEDRRKGEPTSIQIQITDPPIDTKPQPPIPPTTPPPTGDCAFGNQNFCFVG
jgi:hypothetical protein